MIDELQASAETVRDHKEYSQILRSRELQRLAEIDWEKAAPILEKDSILTDLVDKLVEEKTSTILLKGIVMLKLLMQG